MLKRTETGFSHVKPADTQFVSGGLRDFSLHRDLGIAQTTNGRVIANLVKANRAPETGTGWHKHEADFQIVIMTKGWAKFMYEDKETLVEAGDVVTKEATSPATDYTKFLDRDGLNGKRIGVRRSS